MTQETDTQIINFVANATNIKEEKLLPPKTAALLMALFDNSPKELRGSFDAITARLLLAWCLLETTARGETDDAIERKPEMAKALLPYLERFRDWLDKLIARCKKTLGDAGPKESV